MYWGQSLFSYMEQYEHANLSVCQHGITDGEKSVSREWCNPNEFRQIIGVDCGAGKVHFYNLLTDVFDQCLAKQFLHIAPHLGSDTLLIAEQAHFAIPQTIKSLSQPFTEEELLQLYAKCEANGVTVKLFPHAHTRKARDWVAVNIPESRVQKGKGSDENDARGLAYFVKYNNSVSLMNPPTSFGMTSAARYAAGVIIKSNEVLNIMRRHEYKREKLVAFWDFAFDVEQFGKRQFDFIDTKVAFSLASLVVTEECGELYRFSYNDRIPGLNFWRKKVLKFSPFHQGAGVARSNINWHRFRPYLIDYAMREKGCDLKIGLKYKQFCDYTPKENEYKAECWRRIRCQVDQTYREMVRMSAGFKSYDVLHDS